MAKIYELELYKLIKEGEYVSEIGWINDDSFCAWISYMDLDDFIEQVVDILGYGIFDDGGFDANMQEDGVCIDLCEMLGGYIDVEDVFPKEKYKH